MQRFRVLSADNLLQSKVLSFALRRSEVIPDSTILLSFLQGKIPLAVLSKTLLLPLTGF